MSLLDTCHKISLLLHREIKIDQLVESQVLSDFMNIQEKNAEWHNILNQLIDTKIIQNFNHYLSKRPGYRNTFLHYLVEVNNTELVWKFLRQKADEAVDYFICNNFGKNLLMIAIEKANVALAKYFYEQMKNSGWQDKKMWFGEMIDGLAKTGPSQHPEYSILNNVFTTLDRLDIPLILQNQYVYHLDYDYIWLDYLILGKQLDIQLGRLDNDDLARNKVGRQLFVDLVHREVSRRHSLVIWIVHGEEILFENLPFNFRIVQTKQCADNISAGEEPKEARFICDVSIENIKWMKWALKHEVDLSIEQLSKLSDMCAHISGDYAKALTLAHVVFEKDATCFNHFKLLFWQLKIAEIAKIPPLCPPLNLTIVLSDKKMGLLYCHIKACYYKQSGYYEDAIQSWKKALDYTSNEKEKATIYHEMYMIYGDYLSRWDLALKVMMKNWDIFKVDGTCIDQGHCLVFIGLAHSRMRNKQAVEFYERALDHIPMSRLTARIFELMGVYWCFESRLEEATKHFLESISIFEDIYKADNSELARIYYEIAVCNPENPQICLDYCCRSLEMYSRLKEGQDKIIVLRTMLEKWIRHFQNLLQISC